MRTNQTLAGNLFSAYGFLGIDQMAYKFTEFLTVVVDWCKSAPLQNISPGLVKTELTDYLYKGSSDLDDPNICVTAEDIAKACVSVLDTPPNVLVCYPQIYLKYEIKISDTKNLMFCRFQN